MRSGGSHYRSSARVGGHTGRARRRGSVVSRWGPPLGTWGDGPRGHSRPVRRVQTPPTCLQRQPVLRIAVQDDEIPTRLPRPIRLHRGRAWFLRRFLRLVQHPASPLGAGTAYPGVGALRNRHRHPRTTRHRPGSRIHHPPGTLRSHQTPATTASHRRLDQPTAEGDTPNTIEAG